MAGGASNLLPEHHDKHWISDGNIVLSAVTGDKTRSVLFCIHKSLLSDESEVFASMFTLPRGEDDNQVELYEGKPVVRFPDTAEQVEALLNALRDPLSLTVKSEGSDTPLRLRDAFSIASKYSMTDLCRKLASIVEQEWPLTIDDLEIRDQSLEEFLRNCGVQRPLGWPTQFVPEPAVAIALAEDFDIKTILPAAYYDLMRCLTDKGWDEALEADLQSFATNTRMGKLARWDCLSAKSFRKLLRFHDFVEHQSRWELEGVGDHSVEPACMMRGECRRSKAAFV